MEGSLEKKSKKKSKSKQKVKFEEYIRNQPESGIPCPAHEGRNMRLSTRGLKSPPTCKLCGVKLFGKSGYLCCGESENCSVLCSLCRTCPKNHGLRHMMKQGKLKCSGCMAEKEVGKEGILACVPCCFNLCMECVEKTDALWD